jgi:hypothetical protein
LTDSWRSLNWCPISPYHSFNSTLLESSIRYTVQPSSWIRLHSIILPHVTALFLKHNRYLQMQLLPVGG